LREGVIGDVYLSRGLCYKTRNTIGRTPVSEVPAGVDYDLWTGPAPKRQFSKNRFHYNWHWFWDTGNGDIGNQGIHEMDKARWGLGVKYPVRATAMGGHYMFDDDQETPNTLTSAFEFDEGGKKKMLEFEVRHWITNREYGTPNQPGGSIGNLYYGSNGYMVIENYNKYSTYIGREQKPGPTAMKNDTHFQNFLDAVRAHKREMLNCEVEEGAASTVLVHLANISYRLGRTVHFDAKTMTCGNDSEANKIAMGTYRKPFVVPEKV
jgi:predicted dehydrogenase